MKAIVKVPKSALPPNQFKSNAPQKKKPVVRKGSR